MAEKPRCLCSQLRKLGGREGGEGRRENNELAGWKLGIRYPLSIYLCRAPPSKRRAAKKVVVL